MAERLRRWIRNPMWSPCAGSNPAHSALTKQSLFATCHWGVDMDNVLNPWTCPLIQVLRVYLPRERVQTGSSVQILLVVR